MKPVQMGFIYTCCFILCFFFGFNWLNLPDLLTHKEDLVSAFKPVAMVVYQFHCDHDSQFGEKNCQISNPIDTLDLSPQDSSGK